MTEQNLDKLNDENYAEFVLRFQDRQAGITTIYDPESKKHTYNAYCLETELLKELFTEECTYLSDALSLINSEFGSWELKPLTPSNSCSTCVAK